MEQSYSCIILFTSKTKNILLASRFIVICIICDVDIKMCTWCCVTIIMCSKCNINVILCIMYIVGHGLHTQGFQSGPVPGTFTRLRLCIVPAEITEPPQN
jgi:hypothetical protein